MAAGNYSFTIEQGATFARTIIWTDAAGDPIDLTGYTARMSGRAAYSSGGTIFSLTSPGGGIVITGASGRLDITIDAATTAALPTGGVYDLELVNGAVVTRLLQGSFSLSAEVTRT